MQDEFPFQAVEMLNGSLSVALLWMLFFLALHLHHSWKVLASHWGKTMAFLKMYHTNKPEIALTTFIIAFFFRTFILWYVRWTRNHHFDGLYLIVKNDAVALVLLTMIMILGIACWIRVISPLKGRFALAIWLMMVVTSLGFGVGMHYIH